MGSRAGNADGMKCQCDDGKSMVGVTGPSAVVRAMLLAF